MTIIVKDRQCLLDIAMQVTGSAAGVFALAERNGISITDRLVEGQVLVYDAQDVEDAHTAQLMQSRGIVPATEIPIKDENELNKRTNGWSYRPFKPPHVVRPDVITNLGTQYDSGVTTARAQANMQSAVQQVQEDLTQAALNKAKQAAAKNEVLESESGQAVTSIFSKQFNDTFA